MSLTETLLDHPDSPQDQGEVVLDPSKIKLVQSTKPVREDVPTLIRRFAAEAGISDVAPLLSMGIQEGGNKLNPATSGAGAMGGLQVKPETGLSFVTPQEWSTPEGKIKAGVKYYKYLHDRYGNEDQAIAGYFTGEGNVDAAIKKGKQIPDTFDPISKLSTPDYVRQVKARSIQFLPSDAEEVILGEAQPGNDDEEIVLDHGRLVTADVPRAISAPVVSTGNVPLTNVDNLRTNTAAQIRRGLQGNPVADKQHEEELRKAGIERQRMMQEYNQKRAELADQGNDADPGLRTDVAALKKQIDMTAAQAVEQQQQYDRLVAARKQAFASAKNATPERRDKALSELGRYGPLKPEEQIALGITPSYAERVVPTLAAGVDELGAVAGAALKYFPVQGTASKLGSEDSIGGQIESSLSERAKTFNARQNVLGTQNELGDILSGAAGMVPDLVLAGLIGPESLAGQVATFAGIGGARAAGRGEDTEGIIKAGAANATGVLTGHLIGAIAPKFAESVFGQMGVRGTGNAILGGLMAAAEGGDTRAITSSAILFGIQGAMIGGKRKIDPAKAAELMQSPELRDAVEAHINNPSEETRPPVIKVAEEIGLSPEDAQRFIESIPREPIDDPLYDLAVQIAQETGERSISTLQRQLRIGYGRAAALIEQMGRDDAKSIPPVAEGIEGSPTFPSEALPAAPAESLPSRIGQPLDHPREDIAGRAIVAETADGKVVVANENNKQGISVVTNRTRALEETKSLSEFVRARGGFRADVDLGGEINRLRSKESGTTGLFTKNGLSPDQMREAAVEAGYFGADSPEARNAGDFVAAVERDIAKRDTYSTARDQNIIDRQLERQYQEHVAKQALDPDLNNESKIIEQELADPESPLGRAFDSIIDSGDTEHFRGVAERYGFTPDAIEDITRRAQSIRDSGAPATDFQGFDSPQAELTPESFLQDIARAESAGKAETEKNAAIAKQQNDAELARIGVSGGRELIEGKPKPRGQVKAGGLFGEGDEQQGLFNEGQQSFGPGTPATGQAPDPVGSQIKQITESLNSMGKATASQRVSRSLQLADKAAAAKDGITKGIVKSRAVFQGMLSQLKSLGGAPVKSELKYTTGDWLGANDKSAFETRKFQIAIRKQVPNKITREGISNYILAGGDRSVLEQQAQSSSPKYKRGYEAALRLSPDEINIANNISNYYDSMLQEGIDAGLLDAGVENFVNKLWKKPTPETNALLADIGTGNLRTDFKSAKHRLWSSFFEGEQLGYDPLTKDIADLVGIYNESFNRSLGARGYVKNLNEHTMPDGRPLLAVSGGGELVTTPGTFVEGATANPDTSAIFIRPRNKPGIDLPGAGEGDPKIPINDYRVIDHPALRKWKYAATGPDGTPVIMQGDILVHPDGYSYIKNILSKSALRENSVTRKALAVQAAGKQVLFSFSPFHQVQEAIHGLGHRLFPSSKTGSVNPLALVKEINFDDPVQSLLVRRGLKVADFDARAMFGEGLTGGHITDKIPIIGSGLKIRGREMNLHAYQDWLFQDYIPRLKMTMGLHAYERNTARYGKTLSSDQIAELTANQANAAFGGLNYKYMGRNPTMQDIMRLTLIAPDFLEARARFVGQALKPYGKEQLQALGLLTATQIIAGRIISKLFSDDKDYHFDKPFSAVIGKREYSLRTVPGDIYELVSHPRIFMYNRMSPISRIAVEGISGRDLQGKKAGPTDQAADALSSFIPMSFKLRSEQAFWEKALESSGLHSRKYLTPAQEMIREINRDKAPDTPMTTEQMNNRKELQDAIQKGRAGDNTGIAELIASGDLSRSEETSLIKAKLTTDLAAKFGHLSTNDALRVFAAMSDDEKREVGLVLLAMGNGKSNRFTKMSPNDVTKSLPLWQKAAKQIPPP